MGIQSLGQGTLTSASQLPFYDPTNGCDRRDSVADLADVIAPLLPGQSGLITQYAAPNATGFVVNIATPVAGEGSFLLLTPVAAYASGALLLPLSSTCVDGQQLLVTTTQAVTALTVSGNGATVNGAPTTLAANGFFRLRFDGVFKAWYRVG